MYYLNINERYNGYEWTKH